MTNLRQLVESKGKLQYIHKYASDNPINRFSQSPHVLQSIPRCAWFRTDIFFRKSRAFHHALTSAPKKCMLLKIDLVFDNCQQNRSVKHKNCIFSKIFHENIWLVWKKAVPLHSLSKTRGVKLTNWVDFEEQKSSSLTDWNKVRNKTRQRGGGSTSDKLGFVKTSATSIPLYVY